jgi:hypothetical protein
MNDAEKLIRQSNYFRVINEIDHLDQIIDLNIDYMLKYFMYVAARVGCSHRFSWEFSGLNNFTIYMPIPNSSNIASLVFKVDWNVETFYLTTIYINDYKFDHEESCVFVRKLYSDLRPMWEKQKTLRGTTPPQ